MWGRMVMVRWDGDEKEVGWWMVMERWDGDGEVGY